MTRIYPCSDCAKHFGELVRYVMHLLSCIHRDLKASLQWFHCVGEAHLKQVLERNCSSGFAWLTTMSIKVLASLPSIAAWRVSDGGNWIVDQSLYVQWTQATDLH